jgi:hypothetical protein
MMLILVSVACAETDTDLRSPTRGRASRPIAAARGALVYGADDRQEVSQLAEGDPLRGVSRAVAAMIPRSRIRTGPDGRPQLSAPTLAQAEELCPDQAFLQQPSAAECTAVLIDDNLLATAGHCLASAWDCQNYVFVFDYAFLHEGAELLLDASAIYECSRSRVHENDRLDATHVHDFAIVELTRRVEARTPVLVRPTAPVLAEPLRVVSTTAGVPLKVDRGARVLEVPALPLDYFSLDSDTFHGSSGAPVFDEQAMLLGLLARGNADYELDESAGCYRVETRPSPALLDAGSARALANTDAATMPTAQAEQASAIVPAITALCESGYPSPRLCGTAARCGDLICSPAEGTTTCPQDCTSGPPMLHDAAAARPTEDAGVAPPPASEPAALATSPPSVPALASEEREASGCSVRAGTRAPDLTLLWALAVAWCLLCRHGQRVTRRRRAK